MPTCFAKKKGPDLDLSNSFIYDLFLVPHMFYIIPEIAYIYLLLQAIAASSSLRERLGAKLLQRFRKISKKNI